MAAEIFHPTFVTRSSRPADHRGLARNGPSHRITQRVNCVTECAGLATTRDGACFCLGHRLAEQPALTNMAAHIPERGCRGRVLDAFRYGQQAKTMAQRDYGGDDLPALGAAAHAEDETCV